MDLLIELLLSALLILGGFFGLIGSWGLLRLRDAMQRLHAPTKATTIGVGAALIASVLYLAWQGGDLRLAEALVAVFLLLTAPLTALYLARTHLHRSIDRATLPPTGTGAVWAAQDATLDD